MTTPAGIDRQLLQRNLERTQEQVAKACAAAGRAVDSVRMIAVTKYVDAAATRALAELGCRDLGESRPQTLWAKRESLADLTDIQWHMIGHLQRNKVARTVTDLALLHSIDSQRLAEAVEESLAKQARRLPILVEVNVTQDAEKTGLPAAELEPVVERILAMPHLELRGLMAMSTEGADESLARSEFARVRELREQLQRRFGDQVQLSELSMGMSGDFAWAIQEGSTMIRVGSILWEGLRRG